MNGGEAAERASAFRLCRSKRQLEWPAEQFAGQLERGVVGVGHSDRPSGLRRPGQGCGARGWAGTIELLDERQAELVDEIEAGRRVAGKVRLALQVGDSDATAERLIAAGSTVAAVTTPWGDRNTRVCAPDGMQLTLFTTPS